MTRIEAVQRELEDILRDEAASISRKELTGFQINVRLFPNGGLVRKSTIVFEHERERVVAK